ncbi:hypothetical protein INT45_004821, partial [Circinella minor]
EGKHNTLDNTQPTNQQPLTPSIKLCIVPNLNLVTDLIPPFAVETVHNPAADGNYEFRALAFELFGSEDRYVDVKDTMLLHYLKNIDSDYKRYDHGCVKGILNPQDNQWFCTPDYAQITTDAFQTSIALFDGFQSNMYIPLHINPFDAKHTYPIILQLKNNHIILMKIKPGSHI